MPTSAAHVSKIASFMVKAGMTRRGLDNESQITVAILKGISLGLDVMQSVDNIAVINGRPSIYGDGALALIRGKKLLKNYSQTFVGKQGTDEYGCRVYGERVDSKDSHEVVFTVADAKRAGLWGKQGPWTQHPGRMLVARARGFWARDLFPDVLMGLAFVEEMEDMPPQSAPIDPGQHAMPRRGVVAEPDPIDVTPVSITDDPFGGTTEVIDTTSPVKAPEPKKPEPAKPSPQETNAQGEVTPVKKKGKAKADEDPIESLKDAVILLWAKRAECDNAQAITGISNWLKREQLVGTGIAGATVSDLESLRTLLDNDEVRCDDYMTA